MEHSYVAVYPATSAKDEHPCRELICLIVTCGVLTTLSNQHSDKCGKLL